MKNGGKNKSVAFIILFSVYILVQNKQIHKCLMTSLHLELLIN